MPLPKRKKTEKKQDFMNRCMMDKTMMTDYEDEKQRSAVCNKQCNMVEGNEKIDEKLDALDTVIERANVAMGKVYTTKQKKKMPSTAFCGPGRSFPVTDCQHVGTARAFLNRSKFSDATKKKIASCINGKAKKMGCDKNKSKGSVEFDGVFYPKFIELSREEKELYSSDIFKSTKELVEDSIKNPGMELDFTGIEECNCK